MHLPLVNSCRLSGESISNARLLFELENCPLPGIYPENSGESLEMTSPLRVVQAKESGFVQLAHMFDSALYRQYAFAGGGAKAYRTHLKWFARAVANMFPKTASILEVGCGDGWLLGEIMQRGYEDVLGIDPSRANSSCENDWLLSGYFPDDLPREQRERGRDLVICRHVLEHIESPRQFIQNLAKILNPNGELWIEVPDLNSTLKRGIWSNFYQLHCNYFSTATLDKLAATAGLRCVGGEVVEVFGGSILRRYVCGESTSIESPEDLEGIGDRIQVFRRSMVDLADQMPDGTVGYGAAERTAATLGLAPVFAERLAQLHDGNPLLEGRFLAGTRLKIASKEMLYQQGPPGVVLFAISNAAEILSEWSRKLDGNTMVGVAGGDFTLKPLKEYF